MEVKILNTNKKIQLIDSVFKTKVHQQSMFDVVNAKRASLRQGTHKTLTRGEVSGGGKKPWKQKHTGRARAGSNRSPIWRGGGIVFGPSNNRNYQLKVNKKIVHLAMRSALTLKATDKAFFVIEKWDFKKISTKQAQVELKKLKIKDNFKKILIVTHADEVIKSFQNLPLISTTNLNSLDVMKILHADAIVIQTNDLEVLQARLK